MEREKGFSNYDLQVDIGKQIFMEYDQEKLIRKYGLSADENWLFLEYIHGLCRISRMDGRIEEQQQQEWKECRSYDTVMTIYDLLCYSRGETIPECSGEWTSLGSFVVGSSPSPGTFAKKYAQFFQDHIEAFYKACEALGGYREKSLARADLTCKIPVTSFFSVLLQFWEGDEEFSPQISILWDKNSNQFLHFETMFYLQGDLLERIHNKIVE